MIKTLLITAVLAWIWIEETVAYHDGPPTCDLIPDHDFNRAGANPGYQIKAECKNGKLVVSIAGGGQFKGYIIMASDSRDGSFIRLADSRSSQIMEGGRCVAHKDSSARLASKTAAIFKAKKSRVVFGATIVESEHRWYTIKSGPLKATC